MSPRTFTLAEATEALHELRPVAERLVALRARLRLVSERQAELRAAVGSNGHGLTLNDLQLTTDELQRLGDELNACIETIQAAGAEVKDLETGLLDFPALREGREILLCWQVGEDAIAWWHGREEGFAGRKPLDGVE